MNRSLVIPAGCCLIAFAALLVAFQMATGRETVGQRIRGDRGTSPSAPYSLASEASHLSGNRPLSAEQAQQMLTTLSGEYLRPWRKWENSPHRIYSRAAVRPIPTIFATVDMSPGTIGRHDSFLLATIAVTAGERSETVPCVVDRVTRRVRLFADGQWLTEEEWLSKAPLPNSTKL